MNNKLPIYAYAITSVYFLFIGVVIGQNFAKQPEGNQLQASIIPTTIPTSSATKAVTTAQTAATKAATTAATTAAQKALTTASSSLSATNLTKSTSLSAIKSQLSSLATSKTTSAATAAAQAAAEKLAATATEKTKITQEITALKVPGVDVNNLTDAQKKILSERLATMKDTTCQNVASGGVNAATACPGVSGQIGNIAGIQQSIPNVSLPSGVSALSGLSGIASKMGVSDISNLSKIGNLSSLTSGLNASSALKSLGL